MPKISGIEIFKVSIPFKFSFKHSLKRRKTSESIFVKVILENNVTGFGESLPRSYVTGNTQSSVYDSLKKYLPLLIDVDLKEGDEGIQFIKGLEGIEDESRCALEIALLDCMGKISGRAIWDILGRPVSKAFTYSAIISGESLLKTVFLGAYFKGKGYRFIKIKAGEDNDIQRVRLVRRLSGSSDIRVDANGAWDVPKALEMIEKLRAFKISCIEQPTPKGDFDAMQEVADFCPEPVMADESLCTRDDALRLVQMRACDMFNVRLSKCGGIFRSLEIIKIAENHDISYQIGCHVGESGVLSAAARHLGAITGNAKYFEGSYSRLLLKKDIIREDLTPVRGVGYTLNGPGLGVTVREDVLRKYTKESFLVK